MRIARSVLLRLATARTTACFYTARMHSYAAFLGHQPSISFAELAASIDDLSLERRFGPSIITFGTRRELAGADLEHWGGTIVAAKRITNADINLHDVPSLLLNELAGIKGKVTFSLRTFNVPPKLVRDCYRACKDRLKKAGRPCRYIGTESHPAAAALLRDTGVLDGTHGVEIVLLAEENKIWVGRTIAAHDPDAYTTRDIKKPVRDTRVGLLPPKLAQILLNFGSWLCGHPATLTVYDPFCGTGVIPIECLLRRWPVLCSDASLKAVTGCEKNIEWARKEFKLPKKDVAADVWKQDATKAFPFAAMKPSAEPGKPQVIVTETSLGPSLKTRPTIKEAQALRRENEQLQAAFLKNVAACLPGVPVVCTWPVWYLRTGPVFLEKTWDAVADAGFTPVLPAGAVPHAPDRMALLYRRPDHLVGREIVLLRPNA